MSADKRLWRDGATSHDETKQIFSDEEILESGASHINLGHNTPK